MAFAFGSLALNPSAQERLYEEIKTVVGDGEFQYSHLQAMPFALSIMYETLRMYPPVESIPKYTVFETTRLGKYVLPKHCLVDIHAFGVHFHETWGEDRGVFNPKRWFTDAKCAESADQVQTVSEGGVVSGRGFLKSYRYAFVPFSDGPRSCLGKKFAEVEFVACLVVFVRKFTLSLPEGVDGERLLDGQRGILFKTKSPVKLMLKKRV